MGFCHDKSLKCVTVALGLGSWCWSWKSCAIRLQAKTGIIIKKKKKPLAKTGKMLSKRFAEAGTEVSRLLWQAGKLVTHNE